MTPSTSVYMFGNQIELHSRCTEILSNSSILNLFVRLISSLLEVEKKYYADGEDAYSMKAELTELIQQRDQDREQRAALNKAKRTKEGKSNEIEKLEKKVKDLKMSQN